MTLNYPRKSTISPVSLKEGMQQTYTDQKAQLESLSKKEQWSSGNARLTRYGYNIKTGTTSSVTIQPIPSPLTLHYGFMPRAESLIWFGTWGNGIGNS